MEYGLLGEHLPHSFSKIIHDEIGLYKYELNELSESQFDEFMKSRAFKGVNITMPYKQRAMHFCDCLDEKAQKIGAINTVINKDGKLYGYNTDYYGLKLLAINNGIDFTAKKVLILGNGGASKAAIAVAEDLGAKEIIIAHYKKTDGVVSYEEVLKNYTDAEIIVNTTPVGMYPNNDGEIIDLNNFKSLSGVIDVIYNPINTNLVLQAKKLNINAVGGLYMLVGQAVFAADLFLNTNQIVNKLDEIYSKLLKQKSNIVLVGMPASGKSTVAKELGKTLGLSVYDTDELIVKKFGNISNIFEKYGETYFRKLETEVIIEVSKLSGVIIATGGGAVLSKENVNALKQNGKFFFLNRPLEELLPTEDRPLANDKDKIISLYNQRIDIYKSVADVTVSVTNNPQTAVKEILTNFKKVKYACSNRKIKYFWFG